MQWEYIVLESELFDNYIKDKLNDLGRLKWELVTVIYASDAYKFILKRGMR